MLLIPKFNKNIFSIVFKSVPHLKKPFTTTELQQKHFKSPLLKLHRNKISS